MQLYICIPKYHKTEKKNVKYIQIYYTPSMAANDVAEMLANNWMQEGINNNPFRRFWIGNNTDD